MTTPYTLSFYFHAWKHRYYISFYLYTDITRYSNSLSALCTCLSITTHSTRHLSGARIFCACTQGTRVCEFGFGLLAAPLLCLSCALQLPTPYSSYPKGQGPRHGRSPWDDLPFLFSPPASPLRQMHQISSVSTGQLSFLVSCAVISGWP